MTALQLPTVRAVYLQYKPPFVHGVDGAHRFASQFPVFAALPVLNIIRVATDAALQLARIELNRKTHALTTSSGDHNLSISSAPA